MYYGLRNWWLVIGSYQCLSVPNFLYSVIEYSFPDEEAGQIPMACVVRKPGCMVSATQIMDFVAKQACELTRHIPLY